MRESKPNMEQLRQIAESDAGKQLIQFFQKNNSSEMQQAMKKAADGDFSQAKDVINRLLSTPEATELVKKLRRD